MLIQKYSKNMADQSKLPLSLVEMEEHNLLLIATAYKFMQLINLLLISIKKTSLVVHDMNKNWLQQGAYHYLVKELQFDGEKFEQYFRLTRESKILSNCSGNTRPWRHFLDSPQGNKQPSRLDQNHD